MKKTLVLLFLGILFFNACQSNDPSHLEQDALRDQLMAVHDEVMPRMGDMSKLRKQLLELEGIAADSTATIEIKNAVQYLELADEGMMDWMGEFKSPSKLRSDKSHEEIMTYLQAEEQKIIKVKEDMLGSIEAATKILDAHKKAE